MKKFFKDYADLCNQTSKFYRDHWKGTIVMNIVVGGAIYAWLSKDTIKEKLKEKFNPVDSEGWNEEKQEFVYPEEL